MRFGIDYAWGDPGISALKSEGVTFVCRYVSTVGNTKNLRRDEADRLRRAGIDIVVVFETTEGRALKGGEAGHYDALSAVRQAVACGAPDDVVIYFAVDFDASPEEQKTINDYFHGACQAIGKGRVGIYGGYWVVKRTLDAGFATYGWQTYAWSGGRWEPRAQLQQYSNGHRLNGVSVDYNRAVAADFGQWERPPVESDSIPMPEKSHPLPGPAKKPAWFWLALKEFLRRRNKSGKTTA